MRPCSIETEASEGKPMTSPTAKIEGTAVWKFSSIWGTLSGGGCEPSGNMTSASVGHAVMHASHWMQSSKRSTRLLFATRSSTFVVKVMRRCDARWPSMRRCANACSARGSARTLPSASAIGALALFAPTARDCPGMNS